jgi:RNA polymerase sigma-70 factor (family 1)
MRIANNFESTDAPISFSDIAVFDAVYRSYYHPLCFYATKFVGQDQAEDIIENLFLRLWDKKQVFQDTIHLKAFLYRSIKNGCLDFMKSNKSIGGMDSALVDEQFFAAGDYLHDIIKAEVLAEIYRAIHLLPSQCGKVIQLGYLEGKNNTEIAEEMGLSEQTVKNYKVRGLSMLKDRLSGSTYMLLLLLVENEAPIKFISKIFHHQ